MPLFTGRNNQEEFKEIREWGKDAREVHQLRTLVDWPWEQSLAQCPDWPHLKQASDDVFPLAPAVTFVEVLVPTVVLDEVARQSLAQCPCWPHLKQGESPLML